MGIRWLSEVGLMGNRLNQKSTGYELFWHFFKLACENNPFR